MACIHNVLDDRANGRCGGTPDTSRNTGGSKKGGGGVGLLRCWGIHGTTPNFIKKENMFDTCT